MIKEDKTEEGRREEEERRREQEGNEKEPRKRKYKAVGEYILPLNLLSSFPPSFFPRSDRPLLRALLLFRLRNNLGSN